MAFDHTPPVTITVPNVVFDNGAPVVAPVPITTPIHVVAATVASGALGVASVVDGVTLVAGNLVLVKNESSAATNGLYVWTNASTWTRVNWFDNSAEVSLGVVVVVNGGMVNASKVFQLVAGAYTLGSSALNFTDVSATYNASITVAGVTFDNTAPVSNSLAAPAFDNTAPAAVTVAGVTFDNGAPVAVTLPATTFDHTVPQFGVVGSPNDAVTHTPTNYAALTGSLVPGAVIDGVTLRNGDVVLVPHQTTAFENGVYICRPGNGIRHPLADSEAELVGLNVRVHGGTMGAGYYFTQTTIAPIIVGTTALVFTNAPNLPGSITLSSSAFDNTAPVAASVPGTTFDNTAPGANEAVGTISKPIHVVAAYTTGGGAVNVAAIVDGVLLVAGDLVLVVNEATPSKQGIYIWNSAGSWVRPPWFNQDAEVSAGIIVRVDRGGANQNKVYQLVPGAYTVDSSTLTFTNVQATWLNSIAIANAAFDNTAPTAIAIP